MDHRLLKLRELQQKREEAQDLNFESTKKEQFLKEENEQNKAQIEKKRQKLLKIKEKKEALENGLDYDRIEASKYSLEEVEKWNKRKKQKAKQADLGFSDYHILAERKYKKQIRNLHPNLQEYNENKLKAESEDQIFSSANSLGFLSYKSPPEKVNSMINDLNEQISKRRNFSKRKVYRDDEDVTYINERNYRFNKKIARAFDPYTEDLKQNVERGTAL